MKKLFRKTGAVLLACIMVLAGFPAGTDLAGAAEKTGLYEGQPAKFSYGSALKSADGQTYQFTGKDLNWMQMYCYNYQTGQSYTGGARELAGPLERYRIKTAAGSFVGYCIEHGVMVDEALQLQAADYRNAVITAGLGEDVMQNIKLCLFYGRQNGDTIGNLLNSPENGGLGFSDSEYYGRNASSYTLDDWEMATVMLIRESQQKFRDSRFRLKSSGNGLSYTSGWRGAETGSINSDHYVNPLKGKAAYDIYKFMEQLCQDHFMFSSSVASLSPETPKNIAFGAEDRDETGNYYKKISVSTSRAYPLKAVDRDDPAQEAGGVSITLTEEEGKYCYELTISADSFEEGAVFGLVKALPGRVPTNDLLVWECETASGHLQAITTGMADPLMGYFTVSSKAEPVQGEPPEPEYFPVLEFPVSKEDFNPGWDGSVNTPMGDAVLGATYILYRDGTEVDRVTLDAFGSTAVLTDQPWTDESDLMCTESGETEVHMTDSSGDSPEPTDHGCGTVTPIRVEWSGSCTYTIREVTPDGRFTEPDSYGGEREYSVSYYAFTEDERSYACEEPAWQDIRYAVSYDTLKGTGTGASAGPETAASLEEIIVFGEEVFVNDCYRGKITLSKSLEREDVFKDSPLGGHPDSVDSQWKLYLAGGGYEGSAYVRFVREENLADGTAVYRVTRDTSGSSCGSENMVTGSNGDMLIYDIPYGTYWMEEVKADDESFVREKFLVEVGEHDGPYTPESDYDNRYDYNVRDKKITNRIKIIKTDSETGKGVDLAGTRFYIRYKGSPLNTESQNEALENYNRFLPAAAEITSDGPYTFEADENGELTIQYQLPYGIYEITEWQVPEGYYTESEGNVFTFTVEEQPVHVDGNFGRKITFDGQITEADSLYDSSQYPYIAYYQVAAMENNQVKGRITIEKTGEILAGFTEETLLGQKVLRPIFEMAGRLKDAVFGIFAAEDILLQDGNEGPEIYDAATGEKLTIPKERSTHYGAAAVLETGSLLHSSGAKLSYVRERESGSGGADGEDNRYTRLYISPEQQSKTYSCAYEESDENYAYRWDVSLTMTYQAGGRNVTDVKIIKTMSALREETDEIQLTRPAAAVKDNGEVIVLDPAANYICGNPAPDEIRTSNALSVLEKIDTVTSPEGFVQQITQTCEVSFVQEPENSEGFSLTWDGFEITAEADQELKKAVTTVTNHGAVNVFEISEPEAPVYFLSSDGIRTEMYYAGGFLKARLAIPQSAVDKDFGEVVPDMGFDWYTSLTPAQPSAEYETADGTIVRAVRCEDSETGQAESYTVEIVSSQTAENPFEITFADGYTMTFFTETDESGNGAGVMVLDGVYKTTRYTLSELVEILRTDENGRAESSPLPLGKYIIRELKAPEEYILSLRETTAELNYADQFTPVVWSGTSSENSYVSVQIELEKLFETEYESGIFEAGGEAVFGIYAAEKITAADGSCIDEDTLVHMFSAEKDGLTRATVKLPLGYRYYIKEIFTQGSYELNNTPFYFAAEDNVSGQMPEFSYPEDGINGRIFMNESGHAVIVIETLTRYPDKESSSEDRVSADRRVSAIDVTEGTPADITLENGSRIQVEVQGSTFDYVIDGVHGTYIPEVTSTAFFVSFGHQWEMPGNSDETVSETVIFRKADDGQFLAEAEIFHEPGEGEGEEYRHTAAVTVGTQTFELGTGENRRWKSERGLYIWAALDKDGSLWLSAEGSVDGSLSEEELEVLVNGQAAEFNDFHKSVTLARQSTDADVVQVKINTHNDKDAGVVLNLRKEVPDPSPVPQLPELPEPENPQPPEEIAEQEMPEPEVTEPTEPEIEIPEKTVGNVPETGNSQKTELWLLTAFCALSVIIILNRKEKRRF